MARDRILQIYRGTTAQNNAFTGAQGELTMDTDRKEIRIHDGSTAGGNVVGLTPGFIAPFAGSTAPDGWLVCDGSAISRTRYADLFAVIGTTYGEGDGNSTFNLPNQSPTHRVIEFQEPTEANNYTWYRKYDDGWVEQGGKITSITTGSVRTQPLSVIMSNENYTVSMTLIGTGTPDTGFKIVSASTTTSVFGYIINSSDQNTGFYWRVSGVAASGATQQNIICTKY